MDLRSHAALTDHPELQGAAVARILRDLVAIPSVNPDDGEAAMADYVCDALADTRCEVTRVESLPGRPSIAAVLPGKPEGPRLVLNGHMDTVSPGDRRRWTVDPFAGIERDAAVWGLGATDMKGGLACQLACARALSRLTPLDGTLVLHFAIGEELEEPGTQSLLDNGFGGDWAIVTEPTDLRVATAQRGNSLFRIDISGTPTHAATPEQGDNAALRLGPLMLALERYQETLSSVRHPLLGTPVCSPTMVRAGTEPHVIPADGQVTIERRMLPGETSESVLGELCAVIDALNEGEPTRPYRVQFIGTWAPAEIPPDSALASVVQAAAAAVGSEHEGVWGTPYGSDVSVFVDKGIEAVTFGPGEPYGCHKPDERCRIDRLGQCAVALTLVATHLLRDDVLA